MTRALVNYNYHVGNRGRTFTGKFVKGLYLEIKQASRPRDILQIRVFGSRKLLWVGKESSMLPNLERAARSEIK